MILFVLLLWMQPRVQVRATEIAYTEIAHTEIRSATRYSLDEILDALRAVESGGEKDGGRNATGDGGRAIGPYQIHREHWMDAGLPGRFEDCRDPSYARREVIAYWKRWCPGALESRDAEVLARVHNGGPKGMNKASTLAFWNRMQGLLEVGRARDDRAQKSSGAAAGLGTCAHTAGEYRS
jgi:hypothetical protein